MDQKNNQTTSDYILVHKLHKMIWVQSKQIISLWMLLFTEFRSPTSVPRQLFTPSGQSVDKDQSSRISLEFKALNIFLNFTKNFS